MSTRKLIFGTVVAVPLCFLAWLIIHHLELKSGFARIAHGTPKADVIASLGEPWWVGPCDWGGTPRSGCVSQVGYISLLTFWDIWVVSFDANDKTMRKYRYRSP
jgi:hypothetical protein